MEKNFLKITVEDTGMGVPADHADRIFDMFVQGDDSITRKFGGTGIGLALSRQLARELGGDLTLSRSNSEGSEFEIRILNHLAKNVDAPVKEPVKMPTSSLALTGVRVLVVDDSPDNQHLLSTYLTKRGAVVETAGNGLDGYKRALQKTFDIVLMDLQMPHMDGYSATKKLRSEGYLKPIIALTAHAMSEVSARCLEAGCNGYLPKPIQPKALIETIAAHTDV